MPRYFTNKDFRNITDTLRDVADSSTAFTDFYIVLENTVASTSGNPIDEVFGEAVDPFALEPTTTVSKYIGFSAVIYEENDNPNFIAGGFENLETIVVDVVTEGLTKYFVNGAKIKFGTNMYRISETSDKHLYGKESITLTLDRIT